MISSLPFLLPGPSGIPGGGRTDPGEAVAKPVDVGSPEALRAGRPLSPEQDFLARFLLAMGSLSAQGDVEGTSEEGFSRSFADGDTAEGHPDGLRELAALAFRTLGSAPGHGSAPGASEATGEVSAARGRAPGAALAAALADPARPSRSLEGVHPELIQRMERVVERMWSEHGHRVELVEGYRTQARQDLLYAQGRSRGGEVVTWTRNSAHSRGHAVDVKVNGGWTDTEAFKRLQVIANEEGLRTLGMRDAGHMELPRAVAAAHPFTPDIPPAAATMAEGPATDPRGNGAGDGRTLASRTPLPHPAAVGSSLNGGGVGPEELNRPWERANGDRGLERAGERMAERAAERVAERAAPPARPTQGAGWAPNGVARVASVARVAQVARVGGGVPTDPGRFAQATAGASVNGSGSAATGQSASNTGAAGASSPPIPPAPPPPEVHAPVMPAALDGATVRMEGEVRAGAGGAFPDRNPDGDSGTRGQGSSGSSTGDRNGSRSTGARSRDVQAQARLDGEPSALRTEGATTESERVASERARTGGAERFELPHLSTAETAEARVARVGGAGGVGGPEGPSTAQRVEQIRALQDSARPPGQLRVDLTNVDGHGTDLRLGMQGRGVSAQIDVADAVRARFLQARISELRSALEKRGLEPEALMARLSTAGTDQGPVREATRSESGHLHNSEERDQRGEDDSPSDGNQHFSENPARRNDDQ